jgi:hypothetical protein
MMRTCTLLLGATALLGTMTARAEGWPEVDGLRVKKPLQEMLSRSLKATERLELEPARDGHDDFAALFGGDRGEDVLRYLRERIRYVGLDPDEDPKADSGIYAANYGPSWLDWLYKAEVLHEARARPTSVAFRRSRIAIDSPRTGLVVLGDMFSDDGTSDFDRMETLVHEARHSDCPAAPNHEDLENYEKEQYLRMTDAGRACTNVHMPCPKGHALAGDLACDTHPWGAYMAGYVFAEQVFKRCSQCSEAMRQQALATAKEDFTRLTPELREGLRRGTLPPPVLESVGARP